MDPKRSLNKETIEWLARELRRQREALFHEVAETEDDLKFIAEDREGELEERAQEVRAAVLLSRLSDRGKREIEEIDAALERIAEGRYGRCLGCGRPVGLRRLRALPTARLCIGCATRTRAPAGAEEEAPRSGPLPGDVGLLSDSELQAYIRERVREDGRVDMDELKVVCRHGVVYLGGVLPSEAERSILVQLVSDDVGAREVVDHIQVKEIPWEREDRSKEKKPEEPVLPWTEPSGTEDIVESTEEGTEYVPPVAPTPKEE